MYSKASSALKFSSTSENTEGVTHRRKPTMLVTLHQGSYDTPDRLILPFVPQTAPLMRFCFPSAPSTMKILFSKRDTPRGSHIGNGLTWPDTFPSSRFRSFVTVFSFHWSSVYFTRQALMGFNPSKLFPFTQHRRIVFGVLPSCRFCPLNHFTGHSPSRLSSVQKSVGTVPRFRSLHVPRCFLGCSHLQGFLTHQPLYHLRGRSSPLSR